MNIDVRFLNLKTDRTIDDYLSAKMTRFENFYSQINSRIHLDVESHKGKYRIRSRIEGRFNRVFRCQHFDIFICIDQAAEKLESFLGQRRNKIYSGAKDFDHRQFNRKRARFLMQVDEETDRESAETRFRGRGSRFRN